MKLKFCTGSIILAVAIGINIAIPNILIEQNSLIAQTVNRASRIRIKPPSLPPRGVPGNRTAAISRGDSCDSSAEDLVALAPEFTQTNPDEESVWGQTTSDRLTLWFFMPYTNRTTLEFSLQDDREENIYISKISAPKTPGIISVRIPASQKSLQVNQKYRWKLTAKIYCDKGITEKYAMGWVSRVNSSNSDGIWYDSVTNLAQQLLLAPNNVQLKQDWNDLLNSASLEKFANYPLLY
jgi:Domain of Unknown Function (DUF928)